MLVVLPDSDVYTPQQLTGKLIGVPYYFGTHYLTMQMLNGFMPRDMIKTCRAPNGSAARYEAMRNHEIAATTLTEPYISLAEKAGCRIVCEALFHGTEVVSDAVDADTYAAFYWSIQCLIPEDELRRTHQWMRSWDMLDDVGEESLIDAILQSQAHAAAGE